MNAEKFMKQNYLERLNDKKYLFDYCTTLFKTLDPIFKYGILCM